MKKHFRACTFIFLLFGPAHSAFAQCTCMGGASVGGLTPPGITANLGVLNAGHFRTTSYYRYAYGDSYLSGDSKAEAGVVKEYSTHYLGAVFGYGITERLTAEADLGYYLRKYQDYGYDEAAGSGFSHLMLSAKYNVYHDPDSEREAAIGAGGRMPFGINNANLPQHVLPSTGAYAVFVQIFLQQGVYDSGLRFVLSHRSDYSAENERDYQYGPAFFTSFITVFSVSDEITGLAELRHERRLKDRQQHTWNNDSGGDVLIVSPQVNYVIGEFFFSLVFDYPLYRYYNGRQLANDYSIGCTVNWLAPLFAE